jgi:hypothetical protein
MKLWKRILIGFVLKTILMKVVNQREHLHTIQFIFEKTSAIDLNASFDNT